MPEKKHTDIGYLFLSTMLRARSSTCLSEEMLEQMLASGSYEEAAGKGGSPVEVVIEMPGGKLTGCNNEIICEELGFSQKLSVGDNRILFTPEKSGEYTYSCWMYMIHNRIFVYE